MNLIIPDRLDLHIINLVKANNEIRLKDLIEQTQLPPTTLRNRVFELAVDGHLSIKRGFDRGRICVMVYPGAKEAV